MTERTRNIKNPYPEKSFLRPVVNVMLPNRQRKLAGAYVYAPAISRHSRQKMLTPDLINGIFEFGGSLLIWRSIWLLYHQKIVRGVSAWPTSFFALWGYWNLYYYPHLDQWLSFSGGISIVTANTIWVVQMVYYLWKEKKGG